MAHAAADDAIGGWILLEVHSRHHFRTNYPSLGEWGRGGQDTGYTAIVAVPSNGFIDLDCLPDMKHVANITHLLDATVLVHDADVELVLNTYRLPNGTQRYYLKKSRCYALGADAK